MILLQDLHKNLGSCLGYSCKGLLSIIIIKELGKILTRCDHSLNKRITDNENNCSKQGDKECKIIANKSKQGGTENSVEKLQNKEKHTYVEIKQQKGLKSHQQKGESWGGGIFIGWHCTPQDNDYLLLGVGKGL